MASPRSVRLVPALLAVACALGCSRVTQRTYNAAMADVYFAAQEALAATGMETRSTDGSTYLAAERGVLFGFFMGQGGDKLRVTLRQSGAATDATFLSEKQVVGGATQRHRDSRVAQYVDEFLQENARCKKSGDR